MSKSEKFFYYFYKHYESIQTNEQNRMVKTFIAFSFFLAFVLFIYTIGTYIKLKHTQLALIELLIGLCSFSVPFIYKFTGKYEVCANLTVVCGLSVLTAVSLFSGGINSPVIFWIGLCPMGAGMIRGKRSIFTWGALSILIPILFSIFDDQISQMTYLIRDEQVIGALRTRAIYGTIIFAIVLNWMSKKFIDEMVDQLTDANKQIQSFIRVLGHDIANPLTIVIGNSNMGIQVASTDKEKRLWQRTNKASKTIDEILKEVLTLQAIESGKMQISLLPVSLMEMFEKAQFVFEEKLKAKDLKLEFKGNCNTKVMADEVTLSNQVLNNLISNAIKFSKPGSHIIVEVKDIGDKVEVSVSDSGVGIPKEILDNLFDYQFKTTRKGTSGETGTGFGMPLVKFFVEQYGGTLDVKTSLEDDSSRVHGTTFTVTLPKPDLNAQGKVA